MKDGSGSKRKTMCLVVTFTVMILIILLVVVLAFVMFRPRNPINTVDSISIQDMNTNMDFFRMNLDVNLTLNVDLTVKNRNKFGFKYYDGSSELNYRGLLVGEAPIPNGELSSQETKGMNLTLTVMADRLISDPQLPHDVALGALPFNTLVRVSGEVNVFGFIKFHVGSISSCDFNISLFNNTIMSNHCQYKTKI